MYHERKERKRTNSEPYLRREDAAPRTAGVLEEQMTFPNMKESGLYGRSLFAKIVVALDRRWLYNISMEYKSNRNVVYSCKYHVVWCPKYRRKVLVNGVDVRLKELIEEICNEFCIDIIEIEIMPDHVHLLMDVDPQFGIHKAVKQIKGRTSRILRREFSWLTTRLPTLWTNSYFVSTVGGAPLSVIKQYIENQKNV